MNFEFDNIKTASAIPGAAAMIETFRAIGYSLETAVADIVDNSISASAKNVWINRIWKGRDSIVTISDDGHGMSGDEIIQAMRPGAQNPLEERSATDLGRFGLGLKTASFSQCRTLTVMSKTRGQSPEFWTWSLDHVAQCDRWELVHWLPEGFEHELDNLTSGTVVIWTDPDRIIPATTKAENENAKRKFSEASDRVKKHLSMTFHRFLEANSVTIHWCGHEIEPWDPFCLKESKVQAMPSEQIGEQVTVKGYILPHKNNFSSEAAYRQAEGNLRIFCPSGILCLSRRPPAAGRRLAGTVSQRRGLQTGPNTDQSAQQRGFRLADRHQESQGGAPRRMQTAA